jgi:dihydrofolate reductase
MGKLVISENVTLDLVVQDPTGDEGSAAGGWHTRISAVDQSAFAGFFAAEADAASALLMGRRTYEWFVTRWVSRTGDWADRLSSMPKYVVSSKLTDLPWPNTTVIAPDEVPALKDRIDGEIVVNGSAQLTETLLGSGWADELRLLVFPYVVGAGGRLPVPGALKLESNRTVGEGLVALTYALR